MATLNSYLDNPNVRRFLDMLSKSEGTTGYDTAFGGGRIASLKDHPRQLYDFTQTDGKKNKTSAAGRYQIIQKTWDDLQKSLNLPDFGPRSQDLAALELIRRAGVLDNVAKGDYQPALSKLGTVWASLPSSPYAQNKRSNEFINSALGTDNVSPAPTGTLAGGLPDTATPNSQEFKLPSWRDQLPMTASIADESPYANIQGSIDWQNKLLSDAYARQGQAIRNEAVSNLLGEPHIGQRNLPNPIERSIDEIVANL